MRQLSAKVEEISVLIPPGRPVVYLDYPVRLNVGDMLIEAGTECFFKRFDMNVIVRRSAYDFGEAARRRVTPDSVILMHGGGNFGDLYPLHQKLREEVVRAFPANRIVMLPQTLHFESSEALADCAKLYARHPDLHICLRDHASLGTEQQHFPNPCRLVPDMAHMLWEPLSAAQARSHGHGTLLFARIDKESRPMPLAGMSVEQACLDWKNIIRIEEKATYIALIKLHRHRGAAGGASRYIPSGAFSEAAWYPAPFAALGVAFALYVLLAGNPVAVASPLNDALPPVSCIVLINVVFVLLVYRSVFTAGHAAKMFSWTPLRWLGNISYSFYLMHGLGLHGFFMVLGKIWSPEDAGLPAFALLLQAAFLASLAVSLPIYLLIERPLSLGATASRPKPEKVKKEGADAPRPRSAVVGRISR